MISVCARRCFCVDCLDILVGAGAANSARDLDPWRCYMCQPLQQYGVLKKRHDWSLKLQEFFVNDSGQEFVSLTLTFTLSEIRCLQNCRLFTFILLSFSFRKVQRFTLQSQQSRDVQSESFHCLMALQQVYVISLWILYSPFLVK